MLTIAWIVGAAIAGFVLGVIFSNAAKAKIQAELDDLKAKAAADVSAVAAKAAADVAAVATKV